MPRKFALTFAASAFAATGCSDTIEPGFGRIQGLVQDLPPVGARAVGSLAGNIKISLSADGSTWVDLGSLNGVTVPIQTNSSTSVHGEQAGPSGAYNRVRLTMDHVTARLTGGSNVGGAVLPSDTEVPLGGSDGVVELTIPVATFNVRIDPAERVVIVFELRSILWLTQAALQAGNVADAALQSAILASTRVEAR